MSELLRMEHISKRFGNFYANQDINFSVAKGEVHTLLGENGAGKSTLMNILIGLYQPTEGKIFLNGQEVRIESPSQAVKLGIGMVHQHFMLVEAMTVFDNIILGDKHAKGLFIDRAARRKEIEALSEKYGLDVQLDKLITEISVGEQQRTEILKALYHGAELLILDEPSAALTDIEVEGLFAIMQKLVGEGKSIIFISHKMREVLRISDRITILRLGKVVGTVDRAETDGQKLAGMMIGKELTESHYEKVDASGREIVAELDHVDYNKESKHSGLADLSLRIHAGEIVGVAGVDGNGQTQLAQLITGVTVVRTEYAKQNPNVIAAFLTDYQKSVKAANEDIDGTAALCEEVGVVAKAAIAKKALPKCNIVYRNGQEMKKDISAYLQVLYDASPAAVGGKLPDDNFYYTEPSVLRKVMAAIRNSAK